MCGCGVSLCDVALVGSVICHCASSSVGLIVSKGDLFSYLYKQCHSLILLAWDSAWLQMWARDLNVSLSEWIYTSEQQMCGLCRSCDVKLEVLSNRLLSVDVEEVFPGDDSAVFCFPFSVICKCVTVLHQTVVERITSSCALCRLQDYFKWQASSSSFQQEFPISTASSVNTELQLLCVNK